MDRWMVTFSRDNHHEMLPASMQPENAPIQVIPSQKFIVTRFCFWNVFSRDFQFYHSNIVFRGL